MHSSFLQPVLLENTDNIVKQIACQIACRHVDGTTGHVLVVSQASTVAAVIYNVVNVAQELVTRRPVYA